ncbi:hypothetical protein MMC11_008639 [Xylographa trunciseda]|nr:hypothetical protein [Xylographa trunciseda]
MYFSTLLITAALARFGLAQRWYTLQDDYSSSNFFNMFNFQTENDPTGGYVNYVDQGTAQNSGMISVQSSGQVYIGVDHTNTASGRGRNSVRLESKHTYTHALVVLSLAHMPGGICGTWPAFWMFGPQWPASGEIDIIEGVNNANTNSMTGHTTPGCSATYPASAFTGAELSSNCDTAVNNNQGCSTVDPDSRSYGAGFNAQGGGVYAMEWTTYYIQVFFWPAGAAPADAFSDNPEPWTWGEPAFLLQGGCDIDAHFANHQIVFDNTFCGSWAGAAWGGSCAAQYGGSCNAFVQENPGAFADSYWLVNSLKVYSMQGSFKRDVDKGGLEGREAAAEAEAEAAFGYQGPPRNITKEEGAPARRRRHLGEHLRGVKA